MAHDGENLPERSELDIVLIDDRDAVSTCVLCPVDATDRELETRWIRFEKNDSVSLKENF